MKIIDAVKSLAIKIVGSRQETAEIKIEPGNYILIYNEYWLSRPQAERLASAMSKVCEGRVLLIGTECQYLDQVVRALKVTE